METGDFGKRLAIMTVPFAHIIHGIALLKQKDFPRMLGVGEVYLNAASIFPNLLPQVYILIYMSLASEGMELGDQAEKLLKQALEIAIPDRIYMPFAENGEALEGILRRVEKTWRVRDDFPTQSPICAGKESLFSENSRLTPRNARLPC